MLTLLQLLQQGRIGGTHAGHAASSGEDAQLQLPPGLLENLQRDFPDVQQQEIVLVTFAPEGNKPFKAHPLQVIQAGAAWSPEPCSLRMHRCSHVHAGSAHCSQQATLLTPLLRCFPPLNRRRHRRWGCATSPRPSAALTSWPAMWQRCRA